MTVLLLIGTLLGGTCEAGGIQQTKSQVAENSGIESDLYLEKEGNSLMISGWIMNHTDQSYDLTYELSVEREGSAGRSSSRQSGSLRLGAGEKDEISTASVSIAEGDECRISLNVMDQDDSIVSTMNLVFKKN